MKWRPLVAVLLGLLMVGVTAGSAAAMSAPSQHSHAKVVFIKNFHIHLLMNTPTRQVFTLGELLIDYQTNGREATITIKNTTTGRIIDIIYLISTKIGNSYLLTVEDSSGITYSTKTPINMIAPGLKTKQLVSKQAIDKEPNILTTYTTQQHYWWDGVYFVKGYMIKYPHPDYEYYGIEPWDTVKIQGNILTHLHFSQRDSQIIIQIGPAALGAAIGEYFGGLAGAVAGAVIGVVSGAIFSDSLLDEYGCLWVWYSIKIEWRWHWFPPGYYASPVIKYFRIASHTLKNDYGLPNP